MAAGAALDGVGAPVGAELVADVDDLIALVRRERHVMQARPIAAGERDVVHRRLAVQPGGVHGALVVLDVLAHLEAEALVVLLRHRNVGREDVEVVEP